MQISNLTLAYLLEEIKPIAVGGFVNKVQEIGRGIFKIKIHTKEGSKDLIATESALFFAEYSFSAKQNPSSFFAKLKQLLSNKKILSVFQHNFDRVVVFEFLDYFLVLEFFHKSNVILTDKQRKILFVLRREEWKDRAIRKGEVYKFPSSKGENPSKVSQKFLFECFKKSSGSAIQTIVSKVNISPLVAEEVLFQLKIDKKTKAAKLSQKSAKLVAQKIKKFYAVKKAALKPVRFKEELLAFAFSSVKGQIPVNSLFSALEEFYAQSLVQKPAQQALKEKQVELNKLNFSLVQQQKSRQRLESQIKENKKKGDFVYEHFNELKEIARAVRTAQEKGVDKKEVMYKINSALAKKKQCKIKIVGINFEKKEMDLKTA